MRQEPEGLSARRKPCWQGAGKGQAHPQPSPTSPSLAVGLGFTPALAGPHGGQTGGQRPLPPPLQLVWFPAVVFSSSSALPHAVHGPEQTGYNMWSLNYLTGVPFGIRECHGNACLWRRGASPEKQGCAGGSRGCKPHGSQLFMGAHDPFSRLTWPPGSRVAIPSTIPRSSRLSKVKGPQLFSCYFSSICVPQQSTRDTHEDPAAPGLSNHIFGKGDLALARPKLLSLLLLELDFIRKVMEGGQGVPRNDDSSWSLSTLSFISQGNIYPSGPWLQLSHGTVCCIFQRELTHFLHHVPP